LASVRTGQLQALTVVARRDATVVTTEKFDEAWYPGGAVGTDPWFASASSMQSR
jgi:hypothetical protein